MSDDDTTHRTVDSADELREILGEVKEAARNKERDCLHAVDRLWLAAAPFCMVATADAEGRCDVSPKGDPAGLVHVIDDRTIALAERPGNRRGDSFHNILSNPQVSLIFLVPGRGASLRIKGAASILRDASFFDALTINGHRPKLALLVEIETVFFHCAKAFMRSNLWKPEAWRPNDLPSHAEMTHALGKSSKSIEELEAYYGPSYADGLYREP